MCLGSLSMAVRCNCLLDGLRCVIYRPEVGRVVPKPLLKSRNKLAVVRKRGPIQTIRFFFRRVRPVAQLRIVLDTSQHVANSTKTEILKAGGGSLDLHFAEGPHGMMHTAVHHQTVNL